MNTKIYLKYGILIVRRVLIPAGRIQNVDTAQGPVYRHFGLSSVTITTAATTHEIPALDDETARPRSKHHIGPCQGGRSGCLTSPSKTKLPPYSH